MSLSLKTCLRWPTVWSSPSMVFRTFCAFLLVSNGSSSVRLNLVSTVHAFMSMWGLLASSAVSPTYTFSCMREILFACVYVCVYVITHITSMCACSKTLDYTSVFQVYLHNFFCCRDYSSVAVLLVCILLFFFLFIHYWCRYEYLIVFSPFAKFFILTVCACARTHDFYISNNNNNAELGTK